MNLVDKDEGREDDDFHIDIERRIQVSNLRYPVGIEQGVEMSTKN